ncbi:MAG: hypothetical protein R3F19_26470 [Verrucomicrobiales bacterium]
MKRRLPARRTCPLIVVTCKRELTNFCAFRCRKEFVVGVFGGLALDGSFDFIMLARLHHFFLISAVPWLKRFGLMLIAVVISLVIRENYPFSHNPMYSKFDAYTYFLHVTDENDNVLFFREEFGDSAIKLKKIFSKNFNKLRKDPATSGLTREEHWRIAGERTLEQYHRNRKPKKDPPTPYKTLKLVRTDIKLGKGKVDEQIAIIAQIDGTLEAAP